MWKFSMGGREIENREIGGASGTTRSKTLPHRDPDDWASAATGLSGKRILVVEDEMLLALDLEEALQRETCDVVGPAGNLRQALQLAEAEPVDAAILDVNLAGEAVFPVAKLLLSRQVPFVFATAYAGTDEIYPPEVRSAPRLSKPYTISQALSVLNRLVAN